MPDVTKPDPMKPERTRVDVKKPELRTTTDDTLAEKAEASIRGEDEPMEKSHPHATAGLVALSYPIGLVIVLFVVLIVASLFW
jgi:hypothetical protein